MQLFVLILAEKAKGRRRDVHERCHWDLRLAASPLVVSPFRQAGYPTEVRDPAR